MVITTVLLVECLLAFIFASIVKQPVRDPKLSRARDVVVIVIFGSMVGGLLYCIFEAIRVLYKM